MRFCLLALLLAGSGPACAMPAGTLALHECRLEHPLHLGSLPARCASLPVAEDPEHPDGAQINLQLAVIPALNQRSTAAPLFLLAGGPGQSAVDLYMSVAAAFGRVARDHDIVLLDQRGTGRSAALRCDYPADWSEAANELSVLREATAKCLALLGPHVRLYTSGVAVQDLDLARRALGYRRISLYGASYGTRMAELYMRRYGAFVEAVILDGVTDPEKVFGADTPTDGERALQSIVARCLEGRDCAAAFPRLPAELGGLRTRFGAEHVSLTMADPESGLPRVVPFNHTMLAAALRFMSYSAAQASLLPALIHQASAGNLAPLAAQSLMLTHQVGDALASGMQMTVVCSEDAPYFADAHIDRAALVRTYLGTEQLDALQEMCKLWPQGPVDADLHAPLRSDVPTLLLSGEADPVTPPANAAALARGLTRRRHLILRGEGHGQATVGCVPRLMAQFLNDPEPQRLDARCLDRHRPPPFFLSTAGPAP